MVSGHSPIKAFASAAVLVLSTLSRAAAADDSPTSASSATFPAYPFPEEYVVPRATEVGTVAGQIRSRGFIGGSLAAELKERSGVGLALQAVFEGMLTSAIGLRGTTYANIPFDSSPQIFAARLGPSIHFLPYRRFDIGLFSDAGLATLDLFRANRTLFPMLGAGLTMDYSLTSYFAMHLELSGQGGIADQGAAHVLLIANALFGVGVMF